jgi:hypothetical protein
LLTDELMSRFLADLPSTTYDELIDQVVQRDLSPYDAIQSLLNEKMK